MIGPGLQVLAQVGAERLLNAIPGGLLIAALAWLLLRVAGKQNSGTRFAVWFCALLAIASLPFMPFVSSAGLANPATRPAIMLPAAWAVAVFSLWLAVSSLALIRIVAGLWNLRRLRSGCIAFTPANSPAAVSHLVAQLQSELGIVICGSSAVRVPTVIGFFRPAILIPDWALQELSAEELKVVLLHEIAHLERRDDWTNLAQKLIRTAFFFHPAVWWIERRLNIEREMACDDAVLAKTADPQAYAECLVSLAEKSFARRFAQHSLSLAQAVIGHARDTALRLARILDGNTTRSSAVFKPTLGIATVLAVAGTIALQHAPKVIAFQSSAAPPLVASAANVLPQFAQAMVVPASFPATVKAAPQTVEKKHKPPTQPIYRAVRVAKSDEAMRESSDPPADLVRASLQQQIPASQLLLVVRTMQFDDSGFAMVHMSVWRVTLDPDQQQAVRQEFIVRKL
ncbi:MAG TPA: M56 family metallopeptidase [Terriglobales bacterium]|nr:M56 family metallopeptidase [Terriglobales bacterium]